MSMLRRAELTVLTVLLAVTTAMADATTQGRRPAQPPPRPMPARAVGFYDAASQRVTIVGGVMEPRAVDRDGVWSWTGSRWDPVSDSGPPARGNAAAAYDARRHVAVVTGGARKAANDSTFEVVSDSWLTASSRWRALAGSDAPARDHQSLVYDERAGAVLMFGGIPEDRAAHWPNDTWALRSGGWARVATEGPAGRGRAGLVYDRARGQVVLFGGVGEAPAPGQPQPFFNDTWLWDGARWQEVKTPGPPARYAHGMVFDERAGVVLVYSGSAAHRDAPLADMWQWDGTRWAEIALTGPTPGHRYQPVMVYDRARGRTVLYGGINASALDTWEWDGRAWHRADR